MASKIPDKNPSVYPKIPIYNMNKNLEIWRNIMFITEGELETHVSRFFHRVSMENAMPEESEISRIEKVGKKNSEPRIPLKKV